MNHMCPSELEEVALNMHMINIWVCGIVKVSMDLLTVHFDWKMCACFDAALCPCVGMHFTERFMCSAALHTINPTKYNSMTSWSSCSIIVPLYVSLLSLNSLVGDTLAQLMHDCGDLCPLLSAAEWQVMCIFKALNKEPRKQCQGLEHDHFLSFYEVIDFNWEEVSHKLK